MCVSSKVFFCVLYGAYVLGQASPNIQSFASARGAAHIVYGIIDRVRDAGTIPVRARFTNQAHAPANCEREIAVVILA